MKTTTWKRKPDVSPNIRNKLKRFEKENSTDSPLKSFLKQFQYESEAEEDNMTRSRRKSASPLAKRIKNNQTTGKMKKVLRKEYVMIKMSS